jgi:hypothetical protein
MKNMINDSSSMKNFCGTNVNIKDYYATFDENSDYVKNKQKNAKFIEYSWLDISKYNLDHEELNNIAIRHEQNMGKDDDSIAHSYETTGWDIGSFPPIVGTDGIIRDGRTRIRAAIKKDQKYIPCAIYSYENNSSVRSKNTNGLIANKHQTQNKTGWHDFIAAGVDIIAAGELACNYTDIEAWLIKEADIEFFYPKTGGHITKIARAIYNTSKRLQGGHQLVRREREDWIEWMEKSINKNSFWYHKEYGIKIFDDIAFYESGGNRAEQIFCRHILPNAAKGKITNIILYTMSPDPDEAKERVSLFTKSINQFHEYTYSYINNGISGIKLDNSKSNQFWRIIGLIPQLNTEEHNKLLKNYLLAPISDFKVVSSLGVALGIDYDREEEEEAA